MAETKVVPVEADGPPVASLAEVEPSASAQAEASEPAKVGESPLKDPSAAIVCRHADARLTVGGLHALGRCYATRREQPEQERQARNKRDNPSLKTHWEHSISHFLL